MYSWTHSCIASKVYLPNTRNVDHASFWYEKFIESFLLMNELFYKNYV